MIKSLSWTLLGMLTRLMPVALSSCKSKLSMYIIHQPLCSGLFFLSLTVNYLVMKTAPADPKLLHRHLATSRHQETRPSMTISAASTASSLESISGVITVALGES